MNLSLRNQEDVIDRRREQLSKLKLLQQLMNLAVNGGIRNNDNNNNEELIVIENDVDLDIPEDFRYIDDYVFSTKVKILNEPLLGCDCCNKDDGSCYTDECCPYLNDSEPVYDENGTVIWDENIPIYECNDKCTCDKNCRNRVTQTGSRIKLCIFKTSDGRGWGVRTLQSIVRGTYIALYAGMIITSAEATRKNDQVRRYLFNLDYDQGDSGARSAAASGGRKSRKKTCDYVIDAYGQGNVTRFINHSCDPNLVVRCVWINCLDANFHRVCLFSKRDIEPFEELTFDYKYAVSDKDRGSFDGEIVCKCKSKNCRQILL